MSRPTALRSCEQAPGKTRLARILGGVRERIYTPPRVCGRLGVVAGLWRRGRLGGGRGWGAPRRRSDLTDRQHGRISMELRGKRVAILAENTYEDQGLWYPYFRLREAEADVFIVGTGTATVYTSLHGYPVKVDAEAATVDASQFDLIVIPGGWAPDLMRRSAAMVGLVREAAEQGRLVAAICHAGWMLCSANVIRGRRVTSTKS